MKDYILRADALARENGAGAIPNVVEVTEHGVAQAFTEQYADILRFDHDAGRWYEWTGDRWLIGGKGRAFSYCRDLAAAASEGAKKGELKVARRAGFAAGVERFARTDPIHAVTQDTWDADPWLLGCPGVTIDLRDGSARRPDPADGITKQTSVAPATPGADCPIWLAFLKEATGGDVDMIRFLQQWCGYCLTGDTREHSLIFIYGTGGNGKSVFLNTVSQLLGEYVATAGMETFTASAHDRHTTELAVLRGARLVTASETEEGRAWAEARIKSVTGGDAITARFMRQDPFTFWPTFKLVIVGNHKPMLKNVDEAARRRFNIVPFIVKPAKADPELVERLRAEWPAILRWMIDGCADWRANGIVRPASVTAATAEYFGDQDIFGQWLEDECIVEVGNHHRYEQTSELFKAWATYAKNGGQEAGTQTGFAESMKKHGLVNGRLRVEGKLRRVWHGITLDRPEFVALAG